MWPKFLWNGSVFVVKQPVFILLGPCLIQRCWNHFICPSPSWLVITLVWLCRDLLRLNCQLAPSPSVLSAQGLTSHTATTSTDPPVRHNAGVKGSCQSCNRRSWGPRMRSLYMVWTTSVLVQSGDKTLLWAFLFKNCPWEKHAEETLAGFPSACFCVHFRFVHTIAWKEEKSKKSQNVTKKLLRMREVEKLAYQQRVNANKCNGNRFSE